MAVGILVNTLRLRRRLSGLRGLDPAGSATAASSEGPRSTVGSSASTATMSGIGDFVVARTLDVAVDAPTRVAAAAFARDEGLDVLDLVPADLPYDQVLDLARGVDTATYRTAPLAPGRGAGHAMLVRRRVWDRVAESAGEEAPWAAEAVRDSGSNGSAAGDVVLPDRAAMVALAEQLKLHAPRSTDLAVAPSLSAAELSPTERVRLLEALYGGAASMAEAFPALRSLLLLAGLALCPGWGAVAAAESLLQPYLVARGFSPPLRPRRGKPVGPWALLGAARAPQAKAADDPVESRRPAYTIELAEGTERFFEPRRDTCPWCESTALRTRVRTPDLTQFKPGEFVIDECTACGLAFQNPRLNLDGLDFYYRDFYDGLGAGEADFLFSQSEPSYRGRVALAARHATPRTWLDVGTGYAHFCVVAAGLLPSTRFDGLDFGSSVEAARQRGWIANAYRGLFPDVAAGLAGCYDLVSMHHYLEHTRDPRAELEAAWTALAPGGHLLVEVPDPESRFAKLLGRYWVPWLQPQHQQFLSVAHLRSALEVLGFTIVEVERGPVRQPVDVAGAFWLLFGDIAPTPNVPWRNPPTLASRLERWAILAAMAPLLAGGLAADRVLQPLIAERAPAWSNAYRVLAQRPA
ncbi:MAG: class I SAM-dependent methyltransferase [Acidimicrobiales bacterium]